MKKKLSDNLTVGIVQASPVFMNLEASLAKAVALVEEAAACGCYAEIKTEYDNFLGLKS